jgi:hypothetical protein
LIFNKSFNEFIINLFIENYIIFISESSLDLYIYYCNFELLLCITNEYKIVIQSNNLRDHLFKYLKNYPIKEQNAINKHLIKLFASLPYNDINYLLFLINFFITNKIYFFKFPDLIIKNYKKYIIYEFVNQSE